MFFHNITHKLRKQSVAGWSLIAVIGFALILRLVMYRGIQHYDSYNYAYAAYDLVHGNLEVNARIDLFRPAMFAPVAALYWLFGPSPIVTVAYPFLASLLSVYFIYRIAELEGDWKSGVMAAMIWAAYPMHVFYSTELSADLVVMAFTSGAAFFILSAHKTQRPYQNVLALICITWAILAKAIAIVTLFFLVAFIAYMIYQRNSRLIKKILLRWSFSPGWAVVLLFFALGVLILVLSRLQFFPLLQSLFRANSNSINLLVSGITQEGLPGYRIIPYSDVFLAAMPFFLVAVASVHVFGKKRPAFTLGWLGFQFLYFEWGSIKLNPFKYGPIGAVTDDRNFLFVVAPFAVLAGLVIARALNQRDVSSIVGFAFFTVIPLAWVFRNADFGGYPMTLIMVCLLVAIAGSLLVPTLLLGNRYSRAGMSGFACILLIALLYPSRPSHLSEPYWTNMLNYRDNVVSAVNFFKVHTEYPIMVQSKGDGEELDFYSSFQLGFQRKGLLTHLQAPRIFIGNPLGFSGDAYLYFRDEINLFSPLPDNWWVVDTYSEGLERPIVIARVLTPATAQEHIQVARNQAMQNPTAPNWLKLLSYAKNGRDIPNLVTAWQALNRLDANGYTLDIIEPTLTYAFLNNLIENPGENLLADRDCAFQCWEMDSGLRPLTNEGNPGIEINLKQRSILESGIYRLVKLHPNSVYIFASTVMSDTPIDLIRVDEGRIPDSQNYHDTYPNSTRVIVVFATPDWPGPQEVRLDWVLVRQPGSVSLLSPVLYEITK